MQNGLDSTFNMLICFTFCYRLDSIERHGIKFSLNNVVCLAYNEEDDECPAFTYIENIIYTHDVRIHKISYTHIILQAFSIGNQEQKQHVFTMG